MNGPRFSATLPEITPEVKARVNALLDDYGALIGPDLTALNVTPESLSALVRPLNTDFGVIWYARDPFTRKEGEARKPRRTPSSAIDGGYVRLYISQSPYVWTVPSPQGVGNLRKEREQRHMPYRAIEDGLTLSLSGRALGGGLRPASLTKYVLKHHLYLRQQRQKVQVLVPDARPYAALTNSPLPASLLKIEAFSFEQARALNIYISSQAPFAQGSPHV